MIRKAKILLLSGVVALLSGWVFAPHTASFSWPQVAAATCWLVGGGCVGYAMKLLELEQAKKERKEQDEQAEQVRS